MRSLPRLAFAALVVFAFATGPALPTPHMLMRILPREMKMNMHMFGAMYGLTGRITLMAMGMTAGRDMTLETHNMRGNPIGTSGFADASLTALIGLSDGPVRAHLLAGVGLPVGRRDHTGEALLPNGMTREVRLPDAMQLGVGNLGRPARRRSADEARQDQRRRPAPGADPHR